MAPGGKGVDRPVGVSDKLRNDRLWRWRCLSIPLFDVDAKASRGHILDGKRSMGQKWRIRAMALETAAKVSARGAIQTVSFLDFARRLAPGGLCHLRRVWNLVNGSGVMEKWPQGSRPADFRVRVADEFRDDMGWPVGGVGALPRQGH